MNDSFDYSITITKDKFPHLFSMKKRDRDRMIYNMFEIGYNCYFRDPEGNNDIPDQLYNMAQNKELMEVLNKLTGISNNSSKKGEFAENIIANYINEHYLDCNYIDQSQNPHCGDGWLITPTKTIMIESKNYQTNISTDELEKMKRDMKENKINYGIFLSMQSDLIGHKTLDFTTFSDNNQKYFIFIIGKFVNNINLIDVGIKFINSLDEKTLINFDNNKVFENIKNDISELNEIFKMSDNMIKQVGESRNNIHKIMVNLEKNICEHAFKSQIIIDKIINSLNNQIEKPVDSNINMIFTKYKKHKMFKLVKKIVDNISITNLVFKIEKNDIIILQKNNIDIGFIKVYRTKVSLTFDRFEGVNFVFKDIENNDNFNIMKNVSMQFN